jgi:hypothetical protein
MKSMICAPEAVFPRPASGLLAALAAFSIAACVIATVPAPARAQTGSVARDPASDLVPDFDSATAGMLPPADILTEVRQEGFFPVGRPVQRGSVYVLYAVDQDDIDVMLTVDAATGRLIRVSGAAAHFGSPGAVGWRSIVWRDRPSSPDAPAARRGAIPRHAVLRHFPRPPAGMAPVAPLE